MRGLKCSMKVIIFGTFIVLFIFYYLLFTCDSAHRPSFFAVRVPDEFSLDTRVQGLQWNEWYKKREELLKDSSVRKKVLFFCYMRGGSTIGGEMFNRDPRAVLWYEPLTAYYTAYYGIDYVTKPNLVLYDTDRSPINYTEDEINDLAEYYRKSFACELDQMPAEIWLHRIMSCSKKLNAIKKCIKAIRKADMLSNYPSPAKDCGNIVTSRERHCPEILQTARHYFSSHQFEISTNMTLRSLEAYLESSLSSRNITINKYSELINYIMNVERLRNKYLHCMHLGVERCKNTSLSVMETLRIRMSYLEPILLRNPDMYVIYYVRDPRAITASRVLKADSSDRGNLQDIIVDEASLLCKTMKDDLENMKSLNATYQGVFINMRYEDLILNPIETAKIVYQALGAEYPGESDWESFIHEAFNSKKEDGRFGVKRSNASYHVYRWKTELESNYLKIINQICKDVITELGYQL